MEAQKTACIGHKATEYRICLFTQNVEGTIEGYIKIIQ